MARFDARVGNSSVGTAYGAASSLAVVLVWVYYSAVIVMFGAEFTQVWTKRFGSGLQPAPGAAIVDRSERVVQGAKPAR
ncbi:MAG: YhjD/YihY/BrkB family envelope integrity protein [Myxococcota bacterium]